MKKTLLISIIIASILTPLFFTYRFKKVEAVNQNPGITGITLNSETQDKSTKKWFWNFTLNTLYVADGILVDFRIYKNNTENDSLQYSSNNTKIRNDGVVYEAPAMLDNTTYIVTWKISTIYRSDTTGVYYTNLTATYECKTGNTKNCKGIINNEMPKTPDEPVKVDAKVNVTINDPIYKMLAPIGGIDRMDPSGSDPTCAKDPKCITNDIGKYLNIIFKLGIGISAALAVIMLIINGVKYMGDESVFGKTEAKKGMFGAIAGLLIVLGSWALLNTINPALTGKNGVSISSAAVEINAIEYINSDSYTRITGKRVLSASEYDTMGRKVSKEVGIPFCAIRVILERESKGNPGAIGFDENVTNPGIPSRRAFINSGKKYNGESFTPSDTLVTQKGFINQTKDMVQNTPGLGVDWRFSKGLGLTQITLFPNGYFSSSSYTTNPPALDKNYYPTLDGLTPRDLLDPEKNLKAGAQIWKKSWVACKSDIYGAWVGYGGGPNKCATTNSFLMKEATVRTEYYNGCSAEDKNI